MIVEHKHNNKNITLLVIADRIYQELESITVNSRLSSKLRNQIENFNCIYAIKCV